MVLNISLTFAKAAHGLSLVQCKGNHGVRTVTDTSDQNQNAGSMQTVGFTHKMT